jgi:hypothetical protein
MPPGVPWVVNRAELAFPLNLFGNANITQEAVSKTRLMLTDGREASQKMEQPPQKIGSLPKD